ncbi:hypothetical protein C4546_03205 [Candidatus Parcubacteria bacterium]|jgi:hypothetical protein|nr:MAG: hypothetical protein C4546_03205 [Candidatus Parcubacteria bacterium]
MPKTERCNWLPSTTLSPHQFSLFKVAFLTQFPWLKKGAKSGRVKLKTADGPFWVKVEFRPCNCWPQTNCYHIRLEWPVKKGGIVITSCAKKLRWLPKADLLPK